MKISTILPALMLAPLCPAQTQVVTTENESVQQAIAQLPEAQQRIITGMLLLQQLYQSMAEVTDNDTAEAAVPKLMKLNEELRLWSQSFANLPPLSEPEVAAYEERFLPAIRRINQAIEAQAGRIAAAEYYGSRNLPAALVRVAQIAQP